LPTGQANSDRFLQTTPARLVVADRGVPFTKPNYANLFPRTAIVRIMTDANMLMAKKSFVPSSVIQSTALNFVALSK